MVFFCNASAHYEKLAHYEKMGAFEKYMTHYKKNWFLKPVNWSPKPQTRTIVISVLEIYGDGAHSCDKSQIHP